MAWLCNECLSFIDENGECSCTRYGNPAPRVVSEFVSREDKNV